MMKIRLMMVILMVSASVLAEDAQLEKRKREAIEKYITHNRQSEENFSTISLKSWKVELGIPFVDFEEFIRRLLSTFEDHYKNLKIVSFEIVCSSRGGLNQNQEPDFIIIHHETKPIKNNRFETKKD